MGMVITKIFCKACILILLPCNILSAQYQRVGEEADVNHSLNLGGAITILINSAQSETGQVTAQGETTLSYTFNRRFALYLALPGVMSFRPPWVLGPPILFDFGDPSLWLALLQGEGGTRFRIMSGYSVPLGRWDLHEIRMIPIGGGRGWHTLSFGFGLSIIRDPVVAELNFLYSFGFPRKERFITRIKPASFDLVLSATEVINEFIALRVKLSGSLDFEAVPVELMDLRGGTLGLSLELALLWNQQQASGRVALARSFGTNGGPGLTGISGAGDYEFRF